METETLFTLLSEESIRIGYVRGSRQILFVKTGQGGSIYGYENRYLQLALDVNRSFGCSVFVAETLGDGKALYDSEMELVKKTVGDGDFEVYYLGVSKGGLLGIWHGAEHPAIKRIAAINAPLMINFHNRTLPALRKRKKERVAMVYGSLDPSYRYIPFVREYASVTVLEGADHCLRNSPVSLFELTKELLLFDVKSVKN